MAVTANCFTKFTLSLATKKIDLTADTLRVILATSATTGLAAAEDTIQFMSDVKAVTGWTEVANAAGGSTMCRTPTRHRPGWHWCRRRSLSPGTCTR